MALLAAYQFQLVTSELSPLANVKFACYTLLIHDVPNCTIIIIWYMMAIWHCIAPFANELWLCTIQMNALKLVPPRSSLDAIASPSSYLCRCTNDSLLYIKTEPTCALKIFIQDEPVKLKLMFPTFLKLQGVACQIMTNISISHFLRKSKCSE